MKTVAERSVLHNLVERLRNLTPDSSRQWCTLTPHEMLSHLGYTCATVLRTRPRPRPLPQERRTLRRLLKLWGPIPWARGVATSPFVDPKADGTRPVEFQTDLTRVIVALTDIAQARPSTLEPAHALPGLTSTADRQPWAYRHTDHHFVQLGLDV